MAKHISELNIKTFRGVKDLTLNNLSDINIILGNNNCGKTSILESVVLLSNPGDFANIISVSRLREAYRFSARLSISFYESFLFLFNKLTDELKIDVSGNFAGETISCILTGKIEKMLIDYEELMKYSNKNRMAEPEYEQNGEIAVFSGDLKFCFKGKVDTKHIVFNPFTYKTAAHRFIKNAQLINTAFLSSIDHIIKNTFSAIIKDKVLKNEVVEILKIFDSSIVDLRISQEENGRFNQVIENSSFKEYMPLSTYGDGIKKVIAIANSIYEAKDGILLIDEIETAIHKSILDKFFNFIVKACRMYNVQLFATTHSIETVDALLKTQYNESKDIYDEKNNDIIRIITLRKDAHKTKTIELDGKKAFYERTTMDMELRV